MISYDTNVLIYALENKSEFADAARSIVRLGESVGACMSVLTKQELMTGAISAGGDVDKLEAALYSLAGREYVDADMEVVDMAINLNKTYGKKCSKYDALLLASAVIGGATDYYTNDKALCNMGVREINVRSLI